jgi:hypothetical protein
MQERLRLHHEEPSVKSSRFRASTSRVLLRSLHAVGKPLDDMVGLIGVDVPDMRNPRRGLGRVALQMLWPPIEVKHGHALVLDPAAVAD